MTWLEHGYVSKKDGLCTWRVREWQFDNKGKRFKRTLDVIRTPVVFPYFTNDKCLLFDYHLFFSFDIDGNYQYASYVQVDHKDKYIFLPEYPKHMEIFSGDANE